MLPSPLRHRWASRCVKCLVMFCPQRWGRESGKGGPMCDACASQRALISNPKATTTRANRDVTNTESIPRDEASDTVTCVNCNTTNTPLWRRDGEGKTICNACGLYYKLHRVHRPPTMMRTEIKRRKRSVRDKKPIYISKSSPFLHSMERKRILSIQTSVSTCSWTNKESLDQDRVLNTLPRNDDLSVQRQDLVLKVKSLSTMLADAMRSLADLDKTLLTHSTECPHDIYKDYETMVAQSLLSLSTSKPPPRRATVPQLPPLSVMLSPRS